MDWYLSIYTERKVYVNNFSLTRVHAHILFLVFDDDASHPVYHWELGNAIRRTNIWRAPGVYRHVMHSILPVSLCGQDQSHEELTFEDVTLDGTARGQGIVFFNS